MPKLRFPHPLTLLVACTLIAAVASYVVPAGEYERRDDPATGRRVAVAGSYHRVPQAPVSAFDALTAVPRGMIDASAVIFFVFLVGGAFAVVDKTGALRWGVERLTRALAGRAALVIPICCIAFATGGALEHMSEEIIALIPAILVLTRSLGMDALTAVAMSIGAAGVGAAFSPIDPFLVGIAQKVAGIPVLSGATFRLAFLVPALAAWIWATMRHAARTRGAPSAAPNAPVAALAPHHAGVLALVLATFGVFVYGVLRLGWDFEHMAALFFLMGVAAGVVGGLGVSGTAAAFADGFGSMASAALLIGFARGIYVVLDQGHIVDTLVQVLFTPLGQLPLALSALGMMVAQTAVHFPVPSVSGQAVLTMPVLVPLSDLLGLSRQVTVLAFHYGAGLCELLTPTNGALMAILAAAQVRYEDWLRFLAPIYVLLLTLGAVAIGVGIAVRLS
ncbi:MAG TPA: hypothetical protein VLV16_14255 [Gemmatimonadales bacterium]|nr:hypothetical protein [Gemmatimonadales bacterium]